MLTITDNRFVSHPTHSDTSTIYNTQANHHPSIYHPMPVLTTKMGYPKYCSHLRLHPRCIIHPEIQSLTNASQCKHHYVQQLRQYVQLSIPYTRPCPVAIARGMWRYRRWRCFPQRRSPSPASRVLWPLLLLHWRTECFTMPPSYPPPATTTPSDTATENQEDKKATDTTRDTNHQGFVVADPRAHFLESGRANALTLEEKHQWMSWKQ